MTTTDRAAAVAVLEQRLGHASSIASFSNAP